MEQPQPFPNELGEMFDLSEIRWNSRISRGERVWCDSYFETKKERDHCVAKFPTHVEFISNILPLRCLRRPRGEKYLSKQIQQVFSIRWKTDFLPVRYDF
jgi:hypothetical protein